MRSRVSPDGDAEQNALFNYYYLTKIRCYLVMMTMMMMILLPRCFCLESYSSALCSLIRGWRVGK